MAIIGNLTVNIGANTNQFNQAFANMRNQMQGFSRNMNSMSNSFKFTELASQLLLLKGLLGPITDMISKGITYNSSMEDFQVSFETLLGSAEKAKLMISDLKNFAAKTPFEMPQLAKASQMMLAFGINSKNVMPYVSMLGDVSLGNAEKFNSLTLAFSQVQSQGRLMGQDLLQFVNAGFNPLQIISEKTGKSMKDLKKAMEDGGISAQMVTEAFRLATSEGGRFFGGMDKASKTFSGQMSTIADNLNMLLGTMTKPIFDILKNLMGPVTQFLDWFSGAYGKMIERYKFGLFSLLSPELFSRIANGFKNLIPILATIWNVILDNYQKFLNTVIDLWNGYGVPAIEIMYTMWSWLGQVLAPVFSEIVNMFKQMYNDLLPVFAQFKIVIGEVGQTILQLYEFLKPTLKGIGILVWTAYGNFISAFGGIAKALVPIVKAIVTKVDAVNSAVQGLIAFGKLDFGTGFSKIRESMVKSLKADTFGLSSVGEYVSGAKQVAAAYADASHNMAGSIDSVVAKAKDIWSKGNSKTFDMFKLSKIDFQPMKIDVSALKKGLFGQLEKPAETAQIPITDLTKELAKMGDKGKEALDKISNAVKDLGQQLIDKTKSFRDFVGAFDVAKIENTSWQDLYYRMKKQIAIMSDWKGALNKLKGRIGANNDLYQYAMNLGPSGAGQVAALSMMPDEYLQTFVNDYGKKGTIAGEFAPQSVMYQRAQEKSMNQIVMNITGNKIDEGIDIDWMANQIISKLKLSGVI